MKSIDWWWCLFQPASTGDFIGRKSGMHIFVLQRLMGHADLQVLRRYLAQNEEANQLAYMPEGLLTTTYEF